ncbi:MAG: hypothetical protein HMLKMBBP_03775 [Planctomycetes bacterium]|nr:hypothetical protein [Planctomycetota bacterium]
MGRFHGASFDPSAKEVRAFAADELASELANPSAFVWADVEGTEEEFAAVLDACGVGRAPLAGFGAPEILPRIVEGPRAVSFHLYEVEDPDRHLDTSHGLRELRVAKLVVVLGKDFVLTFHAAPVQAVEELKRGCADAFRLAGRTPGFIAFLLLERCVYDYADLNLANDNVLDQLEPSVAQSRRALHADVAVAGRNILTLKKLTTSLHIVLMSLGTKRSPFVSDEGRAAFRGMQDSALAVRSAVDSSRDLLDGVVAAMQAESSHRTSEVAAVLTVVSVVMLPLGLVAGLWGMNFDDLPLVRHSHGFWILVGVMAAIAGTAIVLFRRLGWFGSARGGRGR